MFESAEIRMGQNRLNSSEKLVLSYVFVELLLDFTRKTEQNLNKKCYCKKRIYLFGSMLKFVCNIFCDGYTFAHPFKTHYLKFHSLLWYLENFNIHVHMIWLLIIDSKTLLVWKWYNSVNNRKIWFHGLSLLVFLRCLICVLAIIEFCWMKNVIAEMGMYRLVLYYTY